MDMTCLTFLLFAPIVEEAAACAPCRGGPSYGTRRATSTSLPEAINPCAYGWTLVVTLPCVLQVITVCLSPFVHTIYTHDLTSPRSTRH